MISKKIKIIDVIGLHARPASLIVKEANKYKSNMEIKFNQKSGNLKSILNVMALGVKQHDEIEICADGSDEKTALENVLKIFKEHKLI